MTAKRFLVVASAVLTLWLVAVPGGILLADTSAVASPSYDELLAQGNGLMKNGDLHGAANTTAEAIKLDNHRYEAYVLAALIRFQQTDQVQAQRFLAKAYALAPADKKAALDRVAAIINALPAAPVATVKANSVTTPVANTDREMVHQREVLKLILADADANSGDARRPYLSEFLTSSAAYVNKYPDDTNIWMLRAVTAAELNNFQAGWEAAQKLKSLGVACSDNPAMIKTMALLDRKGWLGDGGPKVPFDGTWEGTVDYTGTRKWWTGIVNGNHHVGRCRITIDQKNGLLSINHLEASKYQYFNSDYQFYLEYGSLCSKDRDNSGVHGYKYHGVAFKDNTAAWNMNCGQGGDAFSRNKHLIPAQFVISPDGNSAVFTELASFPDERELLYKGSGTFQRVPAANGPDDKLIEVF